MHQLVEYILGIALISQGVQSAKPLIPSVCGLLVMVNASAVAGPLSAFRLFSRSVHRIADFGLAAVMVAAAILLRDQLESATQLMLVGIGVMIAFIAWRTNFAERAKGPAVATDGRSDEIGRMAGRVAAGGIRLYRRRKGQ
jgi:hypothetical protein